MTDPKYTGLQREEIPAIPIDGGQGELNLVSGHYKDTAGPIDSLTGLFTATLHLQAGATFTDTLPEGNQVLFYVVNGRVTVNGTAAAEHQLVEFGAGGTELRVTASENSTLIYCHGTPFNEPIVAHGPFVMNTEAEIHEAIRDYQTGKLGSMML
jgi:hypothetical protein